MEIELGSELLQCLSGLLRAYPQHRNKMQKGDKNKRSVKRKRKKDNKK